MPIQDNPEYLVWCLAGLLGLIWRLRLGYVSDEMSTFTETGEQILRYDWPVRLMWALMLPVLCGPATLIWTWIQSENDSDYESEFGDCRNYDEPDSNKPAG